MPKLEIPEQTHDIYIFTGWNGQRYTTGQCYGAPLPDGWVKFASGLTLEGSYEATERELERIYPGQWQFTSYMNRGTEVRHYYHKSVGSNTYQRNQIIHRDWDGITEKWFHLDQAYIARDHHKAEYKKALKEIKRLESELGEVSHA